MAVLNRAVYWCLLLSLLLLVVTSVSTQLSDTGVCSTLSDRATCVTVSEGCPPGSTVLKGVPMFTPWLCGGWLRICCVEESSSPPFEDSDCGLGVPGARILQGLNTSACDWPFVVSLRGRIQPSISLTQTTTRHVCGGVIVHRYWVLTHAICLYITSHELQQAPMELVVVAGEHNTELVDLDPRYTYNRQLEQFLPLAQVFVHPGFVPVTYLSDIDLTSTYQTNSNALALLKLAQPVNNVCASVACLPSASSLTSQSCDTFSQCVILGWGFNTRNFQDTDGILKQGTVQIYKNDVCNFLQTALFTSSPARFNSSACLISDLGQATCLGDQGGPVLCFDGDRWSVQGIIPFNLCRDTSNPNPYVIDVTPFQRWISDTIRRNQ